MTSEYNRRKCDLNRFQQSCIALDNEKLRKALEDSEAEVKYLNAKMLWFDRLLAFFIAALITMPFVVWSIFSNA